MNVLGLILGLVLSLSLASPAFAAISVVQVASAACGNTAACTTPAITTTTGNTVVLLLNFYNTFSTVTDNNSLTWTEMGSEVLAGGSSSRLRAYYNCNITGRAGHTFTLTLASSTFPQITAVEISGLATSACLDQTNTGTDATGTSHTTGNVTTTQANEILVGTGGGVTGTWTMGGGGTWTQQANYTGVNNVQTGQIVGTRIVSATGTYAYAFTSAGNEATASKIGTFIGAAARARIIGGGVGSGLID